MAERLIVIFTLDNLFSHFCKQRTTVSLTSFVSWYDFENKVNNFVKFKKSKQNGNY